MVAHSSIIRDLLDLVEQDWLPEENKKQIQTLLIELIENMLETDKVGDRFRW